MKLNNNDDSHNSGLNLLIYNMLLDIESHPAWVCGLKHVQDLLRHNNFWSHPAWVCGLKQKWSYNNNLIGWSHPAWVCGLKHYAVMFNDFKPFTPGVGLWSETRTQQSLLSLW